MLLSLKKPYISIKSLKAAELPNFVVLTGKNGSGKSHLLQAIQREDIAVDELDSGDINLLTLSSFKVSSQAASSLRELEGIRDRSYKLFHPEPNNRDRNLQNYIDSWSSISPADRELLEKMVDETGASLWELLDLPRGATSDIDPSLRHHLQYIKKILVDMGNRSLDDKAYSIIDLQGREVGSLADLTRDEFEQKMRVAAESKRVLSRIISDVFVEYFSIRDKNAFREFKSERYGQELSYYTKDEFAEIYGPPPWELINKIIKEIGGLDYSFTYPKVLNENEKFSTQLKRESDEVEIELENLSSGEQTILALVASVFAYHTNSQFPKLVLLDEVDASLHPSMTKVFLETIQSVLVDAGVKVILVTHSPTTVALAPEDSIYALNREEDKELSKLSRSKAIEILTDGFATLEQGLHLFDEAVGPGVNIITEGKNTAYIEKFLSLSGIDEVKVIGGFESSSGKTQLKTLFDFFCKSNAKSNVIFVWDCDCGEYRKLDRVNGVVPFVFKKYEGNSLSPGGIENLFSEELFDDNVLKTIQLPGGDPRKEFAGSYRNTKNVFLKKIVDRSNLEDFKQFGELADLIIALKGEL